MAKTVVRENESLDDALRRFKRQVSRTGTLAEARKREFYVKPGLKRKMKSEAARKNQKKRRRFYGKSNSVEWIQFRCHAIVMWSA